MAQHHRLSDVFGISRELPLNYVPRDAVDGVFVESLARDKHIVVYGSSKQGKTCLRKYNLTDEDHVVVTCSNKWSGLAPLHTAILKASGFTLQQSETKTAEGTFKVTAKVEAKGKIPFIAEGTAGSEGEYDRTRITEVTTVPLELDPADVNDVIGALQAISFHAYVVLEDFHYLPDETQRDFAVALKAFHEASELCFIVVGVWLDQNRLIQHNGDLTGRVIAVNADAWSRDQLLEVITRGEQLLNIRFDDTFKAGLVDGCFESVSVVQEACFRVCDNEKVGGTLEESRTIGAGIDPTVLIRGVVETQSARYNTFIQNFAEGFQETELQMYRWVLLPVLTATPNELESGLPYPAIRRMISANHPRKTITSNHPEGEINPGNVTQALLSTASLQVGKMRIKPIILDYDQSRRRLNVVDRGFLIWMGHQDPEEMLALAGLPTEPIEQLRLEG